ncbi:MAG: hypothetical protein QW134_03340 [Nitrososphaeria archaeon]
MIVTNGDRKSLSMINILLLTPYLLCGDLYAVHGGVVDNGKSTVLLVSSSLGGKTTFSLLFLENGWRILTEETTYITKHGKLLNYNVRNYFNIRIGTYLEFKDFFIKAGIVNDSFLALANTPKEKLFDLGKEKQMSIDFESLCYNKHNTTANRITHVLKISLKKNQSGIIIKKINSIKTVSMFLEVSFSPTVMLFKNLTGIVNLKRSKSREQLMRIFKDVKHYSVISGLDYRNNFNLLLNEIKL